MDLNVKKNFETPSVEIINVDCDDVIATSMTCDWVGMEEEEFGA